MNNHTAQYEKKRLEEHTRRLKEKLRELFQINDIAEDLDFGMYRVVHQKRKDIEEFINTTLGQVVDEAFGTYTEDARAAIAAERESLEQRIRSEIDESALGPNGVLPHFLNTKMARELHERWKQLILVEHKAAMSDQHKGEIFAHVAEFFSRYYEDGDFLSLPRHSKREKYAIPYNGEEVVLHWANKDQYYIKTDLWLNNYVFDVGVYKVIFEVCKADSSMNTENEKKLVFVLSKNDNAIDYNPDAKTLTLQFERTKWNPDEMGEFLPESANREKPTKEHLRNAIVNEVLANITDEGLKAAITKRAYPDKPDNLTTVLQKHVNRFTTENTSDFFIHKDLNGFLSRELDFYIKNEVINLDDLGTDEEPSPDELKQYMTRARIIKIISTRIIEFLAQLEGFQKMLWEKKKFVLATDYCMTLDYVPEEYYNEILANEKQLEEWKNLFGAGEEEQIPVGATSRGITLEYLKSHPHLVIDTKFFNVQFKEKLLINLKRPDGTLVQNLDEETGGLIVHSENWQALNLLQEKYREQVNCIYIDPPYNRIEGTFAYKNNYKDSSWISMIQDRIFYLRKMLCQEGAMIVAIDDTELSYLKIILNNIFSPDNYISNIAIEVNPAGQNIRPNKPALSHDYSLIYANNIENTQLRPRPLTEEEISQYTETDDDGSFVWDNLRRRGGNSRPNDRPNQWYPLYVDFETKTIRLEPFEGSIEIWPIDPKGEQRIWRVSPEGAKKDIENGELSVTRKAGRIEIIKKTHRPPGKKPKTLWYDPKYSATTYGSKLLNDICPKNDFTYPKSVFLVQDLINFWAKENDMVLDCFSGAGTTAHAILNLNRDDEGSRKYLLIEVENYFHSVIKPRIERIIFASDWQNGKPVPGSTGQLHIFKYQTLEQYEDALDNIVFREQDGTIARTLTGFTDYMLKYMLGFETRGSPCRLNTDLLKKPFDYTLRIRRRKLDTDHLKCSSREEGPNTWWDVKVDLVETFNYLIGLHVKRMVAYDENGLHYLIVHGKSREDETVTVVWRDSPEGEAALKADEQFINETVKSQFPSSKLFINGQFFVKGADQIEPIFHTLMGA